MRIELYNMILRTITVFRSVLCIWCRCCCYWRCKEPQSFSSFQAHDCTVWHNQLWCCKERRSYSCQPLYLTWYPAVSGDGLIASIIYKGITWQTSSTSFVLSPCALMYELIFWRLISDVLQSLWKGRFSIEWSSHCFTRSLSEAVTSQPYL